jgi:hypothetical protein
LESCTYFYIGEIKITHIITREEEGEREMERERERKKERERERERW